ncbi:hypothetical protein ASG88_11750 [Nocardioides sp. Soil777]|uniref:delta-60 repeat domain-containing protein n=1 Tax=Nocardioides sp. Soil777 TaxID=1736409 RepID=UPI000702C0BC|nr:delta-60 repeat domain-containing protein [Nocardioides sp. Soil777]KRF00067.1 hypothetical protein ASG88_11750 [Nocardioides sp. Soil777]
MSPVCRRSRILTTLGVAAATVLATAVPAAASPSSTPQNTAKVDCVAYDAAGTCAVVGVVYAITQAGNRTYIGGQFTSVAGAPRSNVAALGTDGTLDPTWNPSTDGIVYALAASSDGTKIYLGGTFTTVAGAARSRLAAVTPDTGALISTWRTTVNNNAVRALVADSADRLYVGGNFGRIGGKVVPRLGAVSQSTGTVDEAFVPDPGGTVRTLALSDDGSQVYAGGSFTTIGGAGRPGVAQLDPTTGAATSFAPTDGGVVISMDVAPGVDGHLYFGTTSNRTWAYDPVKGGTPDYRIRTGGDVQAILATTDEVYIGGHFNTMPESKLNRLALASFRPSDGTPTAWNPGANGSFGVWALALTRTPVSPGEPAALTIGGDFTRAGGLARRGVTRFLF